MSFKMKVPFPYNPKPSTLREKYLGQGSIKRRSKLQRGQGSMKKESKINSGY